MNNTIVGVDLAKDVIQVCVYSNQKVRSNSEMTPSNFLEWLSKTKPLRIVFEACGTSNYWKQKSSEFGHDAQLSSLIPSDKIKRTIRMMLSPSFRHQCCPTLNLLPVKVSFSSRCSRLLD